MNLKEVELEMEGSEGHFELVEVNFVQICHCLLVAIQLLMLVVVLVVGL